MRLLGGMASINVYIILLCNTRIYLNIYHDRAILTQRTVNENIMTSYKESPLYLDMARDVIKTYKVMWFVLTGNGNYLPE